MEDAEYGAPAPRRGGRGGGGRIGRGGGGGGRGGAFTGAYQRKPVPRGNPDDMWTHDLFDDSDAGMPRRTLGTGLAARLGNGGGGSSSPALSTQL